jgi:hypothetical protein
VIATVYGQRAYACGAGCLDGYRADVAAGIIYGAHRIKQRPVSVEEFSLHSDRFAGRTCVYCGREEPREAYDRRRRATARNARALALLRVGRRLRGQGR